MDPLNSLEIYDRINAFVHAQERKTLGELSLNMEALMRTVLPNDEMLDFRDPDFLLHYGGDEADYGIENDRKLLE